MHNCFGLTHHFIYSVLTQIWTLNDGQLKIISCKVYCFEIRKFIFTDKPHVTSITRSPHKVLEGQEAALKCNVTDANPNSIIEWTWYRNDRINNTLSNGQTYTISEIQKGNSGAYTCLARNLAGTSDPISITVDVQCKYYNMSLFIMQLSEPLNCSCIIFTYQFSSTLLAYLS